MRPPGGGAERPVDQLAAELTAARDRFALEGLTLAGGEPFAQAQGAAELAARARSAGLGVLVFSGFTRVEIEASREPGVADLLATCDLLVDGRFERERPERRRRWIGSTNQVVHFLSDRYRPGDARFWQRNSVEIRLRRGQLTVNGWPGALEFGAALTASPPSEANPPGPSELAGSRPLCPRGPS